MKVEMRWFERRTGKNIMNEHGWLDAEVVTVLQYRQPEHTFNTGPGSSTTVWSEWQDVPTVREDDETQ